MSEKQSHNSFMVLRLLLALAVVLAVDTRHSIAEVKAVREYRLRPPRDRRILFEMAVTPEQDVLSFIANAEGKWRLSWVRGWLDKEPQERTIIVPGLSLGDRKEWSEPWSAELLVTPDGKFAVCIASSFRRPPNPGRDEFVSVVTLREFKVVASIHASELPGLSGAYRTYRFDHGGHLIVQAFTPFPRHPGDDVTAGGSQVKLAVLSLPDLAVADQCQYSEWIRTGAAVRRDGEQGCTGLLGRAGGAGSLSEFLSGFVDTDEARRTDRQATARCQPSYVSRDGRYEREICHDLHRGFWGNIVVTKSVENILSVKTGKQLGSINEPTDSVRSRFASMNGHEYLLLMEGGTRLVVYEITD